MNPYDEAEREEAGYSYAPLEALRTLFEDDDENVRYWAKETLVFHHPNCPLELLLKFCRDENVFTSFRAKARLCEQTDTPTHMLEQLATDEEQVIAERAQARLHALSQESET